MAAVAVDDREVRDVVTSSSEPRLRGDVAELGDVAERPSVERAVSAVRDFLGMEVAYASEFVDGQRRLPRDDK